MDLADQPIRGLDVDLMPNKKGIPLSLLKAFYIMLIRVFFGLNSLKIISKILMMLSEREVGP